MKKCLLLHCSVILLNSPCGENQGFNIVHLMWCF